EGVTCAACHVRGHVRHGPPRSGALDAVPMYPLVIDAAYARSDFCLPCHQLPPSSAVAGRPLLDTYREWLLGPYIPRGIQCQTCHMPEREHSWKGIHDARAFAQGLAVSVDVTPGRVRLTARNIGAGHFLPTTPTPAVWLEIAPATGPPLRKRIGRRV